jgi:hypothetical protein
MAARRRSAPSVRTWLVRAAVVLVAGLGVGVVIGVRAIDRLDPGRPGTTEAFDDPSPVDATPAAPARGASAAAGSRTVDARVASAGVRDSVVEVAVTIPDVVGRTEGDARTALERGGFTIGTVLVQASAEPAGTVLSTFPVRGERVALPATVNLVVSSGRSPDGPSPVDSPPPLPRLP